MPNIKDYTADIGGLRPNEAGLDAIVQGARRINAFASQAAEDDRREGAELGGDVREAGKIAVDYVDHEQIAQGAVQAAKVENGLTQQWDAILKDPKSATDPAVAANFRDKVVEPTLEKLGEGFSTEKGQQWAESHVSALREHFFRKTAADQSTLAGEAVTQSVRQLSNIYTNTASTDPSSLDHTLSQADDALKAIVKSSPTLSAENGARIMSSVGQSLKENIVKAAVQSAIVKNPDAGLKMAQDPKYAEFVNGAEVNAFYKMSLSAAKADKANAYTIQQHDLTTRSEQVADAAIKDAYSDKPTMTAKDVLAIPAGQILPATREHLLKMYEQRSNPVPENTAKANAVQMITDVHSGKITDQGQIVQALGENKIDYQRYKEVSAEFTSAKSPEGETLAHARGDFLKQYTNIVNPYDPDAKVHHPEGYERAYQLQRFATIREAEIRAKGGDPHTLYDPRSPDFLGNTPYARPTASSDLLKFRGSPMGPATPEALKPPADYPNAKQAPDHNWYIPNPAKPGKYLRVQ